VSGGTKLTPSEHYCPFNKKDGYKTHSYHDMTYWDGAARECSWCGWISDNQPDEYTNSSAETAR